MKKIKTEKKATFRMLSKEEKTKITGGGRLKGNIEVEKEVKFK